jgi:hypothetical protein
MRNTSHAKERNPRYVLRGRRAANAFAATTGLLLTLTAAQSAYAQSGPSSPQAFASAYMSAIRSRDLAKVKALTHPSTLACINDATRRYFERSFENELELGATLAPSFRVTSVKPVSGAPMLGLLPASGFAYPTRPALLIQIDAEDHAHNSATLFHYLARFHGGWFTVDPCPNASGLQFLASQQAEGERRLAEGATRIAALPPGLRERIKTLVGQGQWAQAVRDYRAATGADSETAMKVLEALRNGK